MSRFFAASGSSSEDEHVLGEEGFLEIRERERKSNGLFEALSFSDDSDTQDSAGESGSGSGGSAMSDGGSDDESFASQRVESAPTRRSRFVFDSDSDSESEGEASQRQIKSQKAKAHEEMVRLADAVREALPSGQWVAVQENFDRLAKLVAKSSSLGVPEAAFLLFPALEAALASYAPSAELKTLPATVAKAFNALRQNVRKAAGRYAEQIARAQQASQDGDSLSVSDSAAAAPASMSSESLRTVELTPETVLRRLQEIISTRGRKHVDKHENVATLRRMVALAKTRRHTIHVLIALVSNNLEVAAGNLGYIPVEAWSSLLDDLAKLVGLLEEEEEEVVVVAAVAAAAPDACAEEEELGLPTMAAIRGTMISYTQRLDDEFTRALQNIDPHSNEYLDFLHAEPRLYSLLEKCRLVLTKAGHTEAACQIVVRQAEHVYYKPHEIVAKFFDSAVSVIDSCCYLYTHGTERQRARALLYHVYCLAIHEDYHKARDLMLLSHVQDFLHTLEVPTQILYNRALVQVGLAAFRAGYFKDTYFALQELCSTGRPKELLAQGIAGQKYTEKAEMDRVERQRLVPFHMQINVEMIDCIFLTVSMILEIPQNAAASRRYFQGERRLYQSRHLRRILDGHDRNLFNGPPENTREYIVAAAKALANGSWRQCEEHIMAIKIWDLLPNLDAVRALLKHKIREAGLCAFMYTMGPCYSALSVERLAARYDLPPPLVLRTANTLILDFGVPATITPDGCHILWAADCEPTPTQEMILQLTDKTRALDERNLETMELLSALQHSHARNLRTQESLRDAIAAAAAAPLAVQG